MKRAVVDQPGFRIIIIGLVISLFLGLALRSQISEIRLQAHLNKAISRLQNEFHVDFESAKINLSSWGLPLPALVVQNIRLSPKNVLCQNSQIFIEELKVPISIMTILGFSRVIPKVRMNEVELRLSDIEKCIGPEESIQKNTVEANITDHQTAAAVTANKELHAEKLVDKGIEKSAVVQDNENHLKNIFSNQTRAELKEIYIEKLKIISSQNTAQPIFLKQLSLELLYAQNKLSEIQVRSKLNALKDARSEVYFLNSNLVAFFKTKENSEVESIINISGKLLDGDIQFFAHSFTSSGKVSYELALEHVSARALSPIMSTLNSASASDTEPKPDLETNFDRYINLEKAPVSISLSNSGNIFFSKKNKINTKFNNVQIQIENGLLKIGEIDLDFVDSKVLIKPFSLKIESLPLSKLKSITSIKSKLDSFESLGTLSGVLEYTNDSFYKMKGDLKNIQVVFSNRGRRDLQNIEHIGFAITRKAQDLNLTASDFIINKEKIEGELASHYNILNNDIQAQLRMSDVKLNDKIWEQFTFVEQSPKIDIWWNYKKIKSEIHDIKIYVEEMSLPGINLSNLNVDINQVFSDIVQDNKLSVKIKPSRFFGDENFLNQELVSQVLNAEHGFNLNELKSAKTSLSLDGSDWKNVDFNLDSYFLGDLTQKTDTHLSLKGAVKFQQGLTAQIIIQNRKSNFKFDLSKNTDDEFVIQPKVQSN